MSITAILKLKEKTEQYLFTLFPYEDSNREISTTL